MKNKLITLHILVAACTILVITGMYVLLNITSGQVTPGWHWLWLLTLPTGASGLLYLAREFKR
jgi:hypothetical protein